MPNPFKKRRHAELQREMATACESGRVGDACRSTDDNNSESNNANEAENGAKRRRDDDSGSAVHRNNAVEHPQSEQAASPDADGSDIQPYLSMPTVTSHSSLHFPFKLHRMLENAEAEGEEHIVGWAADGKSFIIRNRERFLGEVLPRYFRQSRYKSFQRQLNLWGFNATRGGKRQNSEISHPHFVKGRPELCMNITREKMRESNELLIDVPRPARSLSEDSGEVGANNEDSRHQRRRAPSDADVLPNVNPSSAVAADETGAAIGSQPVGTADGQRASIEAAIARREELARIHDRQTTSASQHQQAAPASADVAQQVAVAAALLQQPGSVLIPNIGLLNPMLLGQQPILVSPATLSVPALQNLAPPQLLQTLHSGGASQLLSVLGIPVGALAPQFSLLQLQALTQLQLQQAATAQPHTANALALASLLGVSPGQFHNPSAVSQSSSPATANRQEAERLRQLPQPVADLLRSVSGLRLPVTNSTSVPSLEQILASAIHSAQPSAAIKPNASNRRGPAQ